MSQTLQEFLASLDFYMLMGQYSLTDPAVGEFADPIFEFALGGRI